MWCRRLRIWHCHCCGWITAVVRVQSLAQEIPHAVGLAKKREKKVKKKKKKTNVVRRVFQAKGKAYEKMLLEKLQEVPV